MFKRDDAPEWIIEVVDKHMRRVKLTSRRSRYRSVFIDLALEIARGEATSPDAVDPTVRHTEARSTRV